MREVVALILLATFLLYLAFIFEGEPDLWDKWHTEAMEQKCK